MCVLVYGQIEVAPDNPGPDRIDVLRRFFRTSGAPDATQQMLFQRSKFAFIGDHAEMVAFQVVV